MIQKLTDKIQKTNAPIVVGLDPMMKFIPESIKKNAFAEYGETLAGAAEAIWQYNKGLIDAIYDLIPAVKPQIAMYEQFGVEGLIAYKKTLDKPPSPRCWEWAPWLRPPSGCGHSRDRRSRCRPHSGAPLPGLLLRAPSNKHRTRHRRPHPYSFRLRQSQGSRRSRRSRSAYGYRPHYRRWTASHLRGRKQSPPPWPSQGTCPAP